MAQFCGGLVLEQAFRQLRIIHAAFVVTWFLFIFLVFRIIQAPTSMNNVPTIFPIVLGFVCVSEVIVAMLLRARFIDASKAVLQRESENKGALAKWRVGNLLSFCIAETITLFGFLLKLLGFGWNTAAAFFACGLVLLLLWAPQKVQAMPRGVR